MAASDFAGYPVGEQLTIQEYRRIEAHELELAPPWASSAYSYHANRAQINVAV
jgi:hypothetical protein